MGGLFARSSSGGRRECVLVVLAFGTLSEDVGLMVEVLGLELVPACPR